MSLPLLLLGLRLLVALLLYGFLLALLWMMRRDALAATSALEARVKRIGHLLVLESRLPEITQGSQLPLLPITSLGRAPTNTIVLPDDTASLEHALLHLRDGQWWLEDLNSRNGTRLNSAPVTIPMPVIPGDIIQVGKLKLKMEIE